MNEMAITVSGISKRYRIGVKDRRRDTLVGMVASLLSTPIQNFRRLRGLSHFGEGEGSDDVIWALRDVSLEIAEGEVLGIIGRNGSGKSTLLKVLSRITEPTAGRVEIRGRISSLLEVGTGFHQELTGRENTYLNGAILGMSKKEIDRKFDEIVEFSGVERFIDTPIKRYSSGMKVRLAFSVAAHLDPEVLLIDEVLAVGDSVFQQKCIGKMGAVARGGRTVVFVSHNMSAIARLCHRALWLHDGEVRMEGSCPEVIPRYLSMDSQGQPSWENPEQDPAAEVHVRSVRLTDATGSVASVIDFGKPCHIEVEYELREPIRDLSVCIHVRDSDGLLIYESMDTDMPQWRDELRPAGTYRSRCLLEDPLLLPGRYVISVFAFVHRVKWLAVHESVLVFDVSDIGFNLNLGRSGAVAPVFEWKVLRIEPVEPRLARASRA
jgi:lipopolysaccharide transport system ATP-binding protein